MEPSNQPKQRSKRARKRPRKEPRPVRVRCFAGIRFERLDMLQGLLAELDLLVDDPASQLRIVPPGNLHITLKFLGPVSEQMLGEIDLALKGVASGSAPIDLSYQGIGVFKNSIWIGVAANKQLENLAANIDSACTNLGFKSQDKPFVPHITLARFSSRGSIRLGDLLEKFKDRPWGSTAVTSMTLYKSQTLPEGAKYSILSQYKLGSE